VHEHTIADHGAQTVARDDVHYAVPGGRLAHKLFVRRDSSAFSCIGVLS
jgi:ligand-binding SRPBCC domain-containing protein